MDVADRLHLYCDRCKEDGFSQDSMAWCVECKKHFCSECLLEYKVKRQKHKLVSTMKYREFLLNCYFGRFENCYVHSDVRSKYYCMKHQTTCCERCKVLVHSSCGDVVNLEKAAIHMRDGVEFPDLIERLKDAILSFDSLIDENFESRTKLDTLKNKVLNDLFQIREDIDSQLERIQSEILQQLENSYEQQLGYLENIVNSMEEIKEQISQLKVDADLVANNLPDLELFFFVKAAEKHHLITEKAIHELRKTHVDIKFKRDIEVGMKDLTHINKQLLKIQVKGDNISNIKLEEWKTEQKKTERSTQDDDLRLPLDRLNAPSSLDQISHRDDATVSRLTFRTESRNISPAYTATERSPRDQTSRFSYRSASRLSVPSRWSVVDHSYSQMLSRTVSVNRSPREYEQYLQKVKTGRLGQIRESERYVEDEESGIYTNIKNEHFSLQIKFDPPKLKKKSFITDVKCVVNGRFVIADYNNKCILLFDHHGMLMKEAILDEHPQCLATISGNEIAVTISGSKKILISDITSLKTIRHINAPYNCEGITYTEGRFIVNCNHEGILILNKTGKVLSKFPKLTGAMYLSVSNEHKLVCSMGVSGVLLAMSLDGKEIFRHKHDSFKRPSGVTSDQYGNIYVAVWSSSSILQVKDNGKNFSVILTSDDKVTSPWGIDYDKSSDLLVVSTDNGESIAIYKRKSHR